MYEAIIPEERSVLFFTIECMDITMRRIRRRRVSEMKNILWRQAVEDAYK